MSDRFQKNAHSWGPEGVDWFNQIPDTIAEYETKWSFTAESPFQLNYNYVTPVILGDGGHAVLKIGFPKDAEFQSEIKALQVVNGDGMCHLLKADTERAVILIEQVEPGTPVSELDDDDEATRIITTVIKKMHKSPPTDHSFVTIKDLAAAIPEYKNSNSGSGSLPMHLVDKAQTLLAQLIETSAEPVLTHGDLHHDNVLLSADRGWIAIDPKGIVAEPAYEVAAMLRNPYKKLKDIQDLHPLLARRIAILSKELDINPQRIKDWGITHMVLSAIWGIGSAKGPDHAIRVAQALNDLTV